MQSHFSVLHRPRGASQSLLDRPREVVLRLDLLLHIGDGNGGSMAAAVNFSEFTEAAAVDFPEFSGAYLNRSSGNISSLSSQSDGFYDSP